MKKSTKKLIIESSMDKHTPKEKKALGALLKSGWVYQGTMTINIPITKPKKRGKK